MALTTKWFGLLSNTHASVTLSQTLALVVLLLSGTSVAGYLLELDALYRPIENGPATNPLTAVVGVLLAICLFSSIKKQPLLVMLCAYISLLLVSIRIVDVLFFTNNAKLLTLFIHDYTFEDQQGQTNIMGLNTALMLEAIAIATLCRLYRFRIASQLLSFSALSIPMTAITGYAYGVPSLFGEMSFITTTLGIILSLSALLANANQGIVRVLLSSHIASRVARAQMVGSYLFAFILGLLVVQSFMHSPIKSLISAFVVAVSWFVIALIGIGVLIQDRADRKRRLTERKQRQSENKDRLTQLLSRAAFSRKLQTAVTRQRRYQHALCFLVIDIDHFAIFNQKLGRQTGNELLKRIAKTLKTNCRETDILCRYGSEEFALLIEVKTPNGALVLAEKLRAAIEALQIEGVTEAYGAVTVSIGCATLSNAISAETALSNAEKAMHNAKCSGRNQVVAYDAYS